MSDFAPMTMEQIEKVAQKFNCEVIVASPSQLQFDLDSPESQEQFSEFLEWVSKTYSGNPVVSGWKSKSGNQHKVVECEYFARFSLEARIALQAMGGSDPRREYAALHCHWYGSPHPILLFKPKESA